MKIMGPRNKSDIWEVVWLVVSVAILVFVFVILIFKLIKGK